MLRHGLVRLRGRVPTGWSREIGSLGGVRRSMSEADRAEVDPFQFVAGELKEITQQMMEMVRVPSVPSLDKAAKHFIEKSGKLFRPVTLLLLAATAGNGVVLPEQRKLAGITEMIHTASLLHDDVVDVSDTRRGMESVNSMVGNHIAVLAGDFVLARASAALARLNDCDVVTVLATVIDNLVRGEVLQMKVSSTQASSWQDYFDVYIDKTFYKTASLIAHSCKAVLMLGGHPEEACSAGHSFGRHLGLSFQIIDDALDITANEDELGKPTCADMEAGNATAPVLFALKEFPELEPCIRRKFKKPGDCEFAMEKIRLSHGVEQTLELAEKHAALARESLRVFPESDSRIALDNLTYMMLRRRK